MSCHLGWLIVTVLVTTVAANEPSAHYTNDFAVEITGGDAVAELVANTHGFNIVRRLNTVDHKLYHFSHTRVSSRSKRHASNLVEILQNDPNVDRVEQQAIVQRVKRSIIHDKQVELPLRSYDDKSVFQHFLGNSRVPKNNIAGTGVSFNDPYFGAQWYLVNTGQTGGPAGYDVNVAPVWRKGITGKGVVVTVLDDGVDHKHPDLKDNYDPRASTDLNDRSDDDPMPNTNDTHNGHGTHCAGEIAAIQNNEICGVGIAYEAKFGGVRMLDGKVTDLLESEALTFHIQHIHIFSASWGPPDNGASMEAPGVYTQKALQRGTSQGRGGKGSIYVWATGNGGVNHDDCSADGYVSSIYTLSVGCISDHGLSTYYTEICPSTMAVIFTGGSHLPPTDVDYHSPKLKVVTTTMGGGCTLSFEGTSSAAPLAAGCFALVLQANPAISWRDLQHLVVITSRIPNAKESGWIRNGAGHHVNPRFGFGAIDCGRLVEAAQSWTTVDEQRHCEVDPMNSAVEIAGGMKAEQTMDVTACVDPAEHIDKLEHVQLHVTLSHPQRGQISLSLTSPSGMTTVILKNRPNDNSAKGIDFTFMTVHNWGEYPFGVWKLTVDNSGGGVAELEKWSLTLYGTASIVSEHDSRQMDVGTAVKVGVFSTVNDKQSEHLQPQQLRKLMQSEQATDNKLHIRASEDGQEEKDSKKDAILTKPGILSLLSRMLVKNENRNRQDEQNKLIKRQYVGGTDVEHVEKGLTKHQLHRVLRKLEKLLALIKRDHISQE